MLLWWWDDHVICQHGAEAREMQEVFQQAKLRMKTRFVDAWKACS